MAIESMSSMTSQPSMNTIVSMLKGTERDTLLDIEELHKASEYYAKVREVYKPFESGMYAPNAEIYKYEIPGGQYSNLLAQVKDMGEKDRFDDILKQIHLTKDDTLYVLGDVIDRNPEGLNLLKYIIKHPNIKMILGNHEKMCLDTFWSNNDYDARRLWRNNGGGITHRIMTYILPTEDRLRILRFIQELPDHLEITVNGQDFYLVHGMPGETQHDRIWGRPEPPPEIPPIPGKTVIVGHTCTYYMNLYIDGHDENVPFEIFYAPGLIDVDCGCGNETELRRLACLRLDDMKEFYC